MLASFARRRRQGFSLIELLVVIAIIAVLMGLVAAALFPTISVQRQARTEDGIRQLDRLLTTHWKKVIEDAKNEPLPPALYNDLAGDGGLSSSNAQRARVLLIKFRLAEAFPQSYGEITTANSNGGIYGKDAKGRAYLPVRKHMKTYYDGIKAATTNDPNTQSAACLFLALSVDRGAVLDSQLHGAWIGDTDGDGVKEIIDRWGRPMHFQRFPIGNAALVNLNPRKGTAAAIKGDPVDPDGWLQADGWYNSANGKAFSGLLNHPFPAGAPQPYFEPLISSDGRDELPNTADDIFNFNVRQDKS